MRRLLVVAAALTVTACTTTAGSGSTPGGGRSVDSGTAEQHTAYGYGAKSSGVDYQPGVVVVGGGPAGIKGASDDGLTWTIAASAPGAKNLKVGSVMLMTSVAAGRVVALRDEGANRVVTIAPAQLTDILRNGKIDVHQKLDTKSMAFQPVPGLAPGVTKASADEIPSPAHSLLEGGLAGGGTLPKPTTYSPILTVGPYKVKPFFDTTGKFGVGLERLSPTLKLTADIAFTSQNLTVSGSLGVSNGKSGGANLRIDGLTGMQISFGAGAAFTSNEDGRTPSGGSDSNGATLVVPGEYRMQVPPSPATAELPVTVTVKYKFSVSLAITGRNSTILGNGKYKLDGPIGFANGAPLVPKITVVQSLIDSLGGITLGPSGVVIALNVKTQVGVGTPLVNAGPNTAVTVAVGATNGSSLGASLTRCRGASLDIDIALGAGVSVDKSLLGVLEKILPKNAKVELGLEVKKRVLHREQVVPDVPLCH